MHSLPHLQILCDGYCSSPIYVPDSDESRSPDAPKPPGNVADGFTTPFTSPLPAGASGVRCASPPWSSHTLTDGLIQVFDDACGELQALKMALQQAPASLSQAFSPRLFRLSVEQCTCRTLLMSDPEVDMARRKQTVVRFRQMARASRDLWLLAPAKPLEALLRQETELLNRIQHTAPAERTQWRITWRAQHDRNAVLDDIDGLRSGLSRLDRLTQPAPGIAKTFVFPAASPTDVRPVASTTGFRLTVARNWLLDPGTLWAADSHGGIQARASALRERLSRLPPGQLLLSRNTVNGNALQLLREVEAFRRLLAAAPLRVVEERLAQRQLCERRQQAAFSVPGLHEDIGPDLTQAMQSQLDELMQHIDVQVTLVGYDEALCTFEARLAGMADDLLRLAEVTPAPPPETPTRLGD